MPLDTSSTALGPSANANADLCGNYSSSVTGDGTAGGNITSDCANGKAIVDNAYSSTNGDVNKMTAGCAAIYAGARQAFDPNASIAQKTEGLLEIEAGVGGLAYIATQAVAAGVSVALIDAATGAAIAAEIPVVGWIAAIGIVAAVVIVAVFDAVVPVASGKPVPWSSADQAKYVIESMIGQMPTSALPGAPFTDASRQLASLGASYVQAQLAASGNQNKTMAMTNAPSSGFGYQAANAAIVTEEIAVMFGGDHGKADTFLSIVSVLWDPRWGGTDSARDVVLGEAMGLDPANPQNILGGTLDPYTQVLTPVTGEKGLPAASYLCEIAAAAFLANMTDVPGRVYAAMYLRLCQTAWFYKACQDADGNTPISAPPSLLATLGFMLDAAVQNGASTSNPLLLSGNVGPKTAVKATANLGLTAASRDLSYWVHYYLALGGATS